MIRIDTAVCANQYFHQMTFTEVGDVIPTHEHAYDHVLQVQRGKVRIYSSADGMEDLTAPALKSIPAGIGHDLEALEPETVCCCIHVLRDEAGQMYPFAYQLTGREMRLATERC
jgi:quercetin dioxygenase-like cupin family protein